MGDYRTTTGESAPVPEAMRRRRRLRLAGLALVGGLALGVLGSSIRVTRRVPAGGYVTTETYAEVRPATAGVVSEIRVGTGAAVAAGEVLVQLDAAEQTAALAEARSQLRKAAAELARRETGIAQDQALLADQIALARLRVRNVQTRLARARELQSRGLASGAAVEDVLLQDEIARTELASLESRTPEGFERERDVLRHEVDSRAESVARAEARVRQRSVVSPIAGRVVRYEFVVGELVRPETVLYEVFGGETRVLKLRVDERYATQVHTGQPYRAWLSSYRGPWRPRFTGEIEFLRDVIQVEGQRAYRTAYCDFDGQGREVPPGTTAEAEIAVGKVCLWAFLLGL